MKSLLVYICLFFSILKVSHANESLNNNEVNIQQDSLTFWIKRSRDSKVTQQLREAYLEKAYKKAKELPNDSLRNAYLLKISFSYYKLDDSLLFRKINHESIQLSREINDSTSLAANYWDLGKFYSIKGAKDSAYYMYSKAQQLYASLGNDLYAGNMLLNMAIMQSDVKDYTGSEITTIKAIELFKPLEKYNLLYRAYNNLGINLNNLQQYDKALLYHENALEYQRKIKTENTFRENTYNNIGVVYTNKKEYSNAIDYYNRALENDELREKNIRLYARLLDNLAYSKMNIDDTLGIKRLFYRALSIRDSVNDQLGQAINKLHLAEFYLLKNDTAKAKQLAQETKQLAQETKNYRELLPALLLLSKVDKKESYAFTNRYIQLNDSLMQAERATRNKFTRIKFETDEFKSENVKLAKQNQVILFMSLIVILIFIMAYVILMQHSKNQKLVLEQQQQMINEDIYNLMIVQQNKIDEGKRMEKKRLSEELHDGALGKIFGTRLILSTLNNNNDAETVERRHKYIEELKLVEEELRNISHELNSESQIANLGYANMIDDLLEKQSEISNFKYEFGYDKTIVWEKLRASLKMNLYRIIQEATQNINKYAKAKNVKVTFEVANDMLVLKINDDGIGFKTETKHKGIGLNNIHSRVQRLGGTSSITSKQNIGTQIFIKVPYE